MMLIAKIYINHRPIDNIYIHNTAKKEDGKCVYELIKPGTREKLTKTTITHRRLDGYRKLLIEALNLLEEEEIETVPVIPSMFDVEPELEDI
jgi:hypothetical protein